MLTETHLAIDYLVGNKVDLKEQENSRRSRIMRLLIRICTDEYYLSLFEIGSVEERMPEREYYDSTTDSDQRISGLLLLQDTNSELLMTQRGIEYFHFPDGVRNLCSRADNRILVIDRSRICKGDRLGVVIPFDREDILFEGDGLLTGSLDASTNIIYDNFEAFDNILSA